MLRSMSVTIISTLEFDVAIPILVEESCGERDSLHDKLQVLNALALLFESHGATVVDVDDDVVESESRNVRCISVVTVAACLLT